jgi:hypothetical protein
MMFSPNGLLVPKDLCIIWLLNLSILSWMLYKKHAVYVKLDFYVFIKRYLKKTQILP